MVTVIMSLFNTCSCGKDISEVRKKYPSVWECYDCKYPNPHKGRCNCCGTKMPQDAKYRTCYACFQRKK